MSYCMRQDETDEEVWELGETMPDFPKLGVLCEMLTAQEGIQSVVPGRQALESRVVSQDLEMFMPKAAAEDGCVCVCVCVVCICFECVRSLVVLASVGNRIPALVIHGTPSAFFAPRETHWGCCSACEQGV